MVKRTLYFGNPSYLSLRNSQMVFRLMDNVAFKVIPEKECEPRTFPIEDIGILVLDHKQITITQGLMAALLENGCAVITCSDNHLPTGLMLPLAGNTLQSERFQYQINCSLPLKKQMWQQTIKAKIANQAAVLSQNTNAETNNMNVWKGDVRSDDSTNLEGRAAAYYWKNLLDTDEDFVRNQFGMWPNCLFNYGYAVLRAIVARSLVCKGLLPTLGIHHHNRYNAYCLADDIMEPYRPFVDALVLKILEKYPDAKELEKELKRELLTIPVIEVRIDNHRSPLMVAVNTTVDSLVKCYMGISRTIIYPVYETKGCFQ